MSTRHATIATPLGDLLALAEADALTGLYFPAHWHPPAVGSIGVQVDADSDALFPRVEEELAAYFAGQRTTFDLSTAATGDAFEHEVWRMLREIPYGETITYGAIAETLGDRNLARRVGYAVGHNPVSIVVPCHRVVGADGSLTGYAGGLDRKRFLLELEGAAVVAQRRLF